MEDLVGNSEELTHHGVKQMLALLGLIFVKSLVMIVLFLVLGYLMCILVNRCIGRGRNEGERKLLKAMILLGSGGHTKEILAVSKELAKVFPIRFYVATSSDQLSMIKAKELESNNASADTSGGVGTRRVEYYTVHRIREVGQRWATVFLYSGPISLLQSAILMFRLKPRVIVCNGPGMCVPICLVAKLMKTLRMCKTEIIFMESVCRTKNLSLTGKVMIYLSDHLIVQWEDLKKHCEENYSSRKDKIRYWGRCA